MVQIFDTTIDFPTYTYQVYLTPYVAIDCAGKIPNVFHRFMMKVFFGWKFEAIS